MLGSAVASAGDVNRDGFGDMIVSAPNAAVFGLGSGTGHAYVLFGGATPDTIPDITFTGQTGVEFLGTVCLGRRRERRRLQ